MSEHQEIIDELWNEYHDMYSIQHAATPKEINELRDSIEELFSDDLFMSSINKDELAQLETLYASFSENNHVEKMDTVDEQQDTSCPMLPCSSCGMCGYYTIIGEE